MKRKTKKELNIEAGYIENALKDGMPALEIMTRQDLTRIQFNNHLAAIFERGGGQAYTPAYHVFRLTAFPEEIQRMLEHEGDSCALIKGEVTNDGVLLSVIQIRDDDFEPDEPGELAEPGRYSPLA